MITIKPCTADHGYACGVWFASFAGALLYDKSPEAALREAWRRWGGHHAALIYTRRP